MRGWETKQKITAKWLQMFKKKNYQMYRVQRLKLEDAPPMEELPQLHTRLLVETPKGETRI